VDRIVEQWAGERPDLDTTAMAVLGLIRIESAQQDDHDRLQELVESRFSEAGGPPDGLLAHIAHPDGGDFIIVEAWRSEDLFRSYVEAIVVPALVAADLRHSGIEVRPIWSLARP